MVSKLSWQVTDPKSAVPKHWTTKKAEGDDEGGHNGNGGGMAGGGGMVGFSGFGGMGMGGGFGGQAEKNDDAAVIVSLMVNDEHVANICPKTRFVHGDDSTKLILSNHINLAPTKTTFSKGDVVQRKKLGVGEGVEVVLEEPSETAPSVSGTVIHVNIDDTYDVEFSDGSVGLHCSC
jgi:hypothetical protein